MKAEVEKSDVEEHRGCRSSVDVLTVADELIRRKEVG